MIASYGLPTLAPAVQHELICVPLVQISHALLNPHPNRTQLVLAQRHADRLTLEVNVLPSNYATLVRYNGG